MSKRIRAVVLLVFSIFISACSQLTYSDKKGEVWVKYDGYRAVSAFAMDNQGHMWAASEDEPDGYVIRTVDNDKPQVIHLPPPSKTFLRSSILSMAFDQHGRLWATSAVDGSVYLRNEDGHWISYYIGETDLPKLAIDRQDRVWVMALAKDLYWIDPSTGVIAAAELKGGVIDFAIDGQGQVWVLHEGKVKVLKNGVWEVVSKSDGVDAIAISEQGVVWVRTHQGVRLLNSDGNWKEYPYEEPTEPIYKAFALDKRGRLWVGTETGLLVLDREVGWMKYTIVNSTLTDNWVSCIYIDPKGQLWVGADQIAMLDLNTVK